jgi:uncharacterized protein (DUF1684 family)
VTQSARHRCGVILATLLGALLASCTPPPPDEGQILKETEEFRAAKDRAFAGDGSPVPRDRRSQLLPLAYFPVSLEYRVPAALSLSRDRSSIEMPTSTGQMRTMMRVGRLEFTLKGQAMGLSAFVEAGARDLSRLFVPFSDLTSGSETYPAGRYLDLDRTPTGLYVIDFNRAYHPFCYYDPSYDCPYPPRENRLAVPIRAGERVKP